MARLTRDDAARIAALAKLEMTPDELERAARELASILDHFDVIARVDTSGVELAAPGDGEDIRRADEVRQPLDPADTFRNAPDADRESGLFRVPRVIGS